MKKYLVWLRASIAMVGCVSAAMADKTGSSPFTDNLAISLQGFSDGTIFLANYSDDNSVNIAGPSIFTDQTNAPVVISSSNLYQNGFPSMMLSYATDAGEQTCVLNFVDGPWTNLAYQYVNPPVCQGITVGALVGSGSYAYQLTISKQ